MGLLSTIRVMDTLPIIRAAPGGAAEMLAKTLFQSLSENLTARGPAYSLFAVREMTLSVNDVDC